MPNVPELPALDVVLGLVSAILVVLAAFYLARARWSEKPIRHGFSRQRAPEQLFREISPDQTGHRLSIIGSLFLHVFVAAAVPALQILMSGPVPDLRRYDLVVLQYQLPDLPFRVPSDVSRFQPRQPEPMTPAEVLAAVDLGRPQGAAPQTQKSKGPGEGPVVAAKAPVKAPTSPALLEVVMESGAAIELPSQASNLPPVLLLSVADSALGNLKPAAPERWQLPESPTPGITPGDRSLADLGVEDGPLDSGSTRVAQGQSLSGGDFWKILEASGGLSSIGGLGEGQGSGTGGAAGGGDPNALLRAALEGGVLSGLAGGDPEGAETGALGGDGETNRLRAGEKDGSEAAQWKKGQLRPVPRKLHGIILISNALSTLPEAAGVLTGNPVYTVYLDVPGAEQKWIFQVCVPGGQSRTLEYSGGVIRFLPRKSLNPPYATRREPLDVSSLRPVNDGESHRVVVYATVDEAGVLRNIRVIRGAYPEIDNSIVANLQSWEFLPAFENGEPVAVEALFGIPLN